MNNNDINISPDMISPDMINNLVNMLKTNSAPDHKDGSENSQTGNANNIDFGEILSKLSSNSSDDSTQNGSSLDFETIMKMKSIMETLNSKNDPNSNLLYSLKPYLRKSKQAKLDQYANLMKISQVTNLFKNDKGDSK